MRRISALAIIALTLISSCGNNMGTNADVVSENGKDELFFPIDSLPVDSDMVHQCISVDGKMKFVSWNTCMGGTCPRMMEFLNIMST